MNEGYWFAVFSLHHVQFVYKIEVLYRPFPCLRENDSLVENLYSYIHNRISSSVNTSCQIVLYRRNLIKESRFLSEYKVFPWIDWGRYNWWRAWSSSEVLFIIHKEPTAFWDRLINNRDHDKINEFSVEYTTQFLRLNLRNGNPNRNLNS